MSEMVERVAKAMHNAREAEDHWWTAWDDMPESYREKSLTLVRAGVLAMREPTEKMVDAGVQVTVDSAAYDAADEVEIYQSMIDAALS